MLNVFVYRPIWMKLSRPITCKKFLSNTYVEWNFQNHGCSKYTPTSVAPEISWCTNNAWRGLRRRRYTRTASLCTREQLADRIRYLKITVLSIHRRRSLALWRTTSHARLPVAPEHWTSHELRTTTTTGGAGPPKWSLNDCCPRHVATYHHQPTVPRDMPPARVDR